LSHWPEYEPTSEGDRSIGRTERGAPADSRNAQVRSGCILLSMTFVPGRPRPFDREANSSQWLVFGGIRLRGIHSSERLQRARKQRGGSSANPTSSQLPGDIAFDPRHPQHHFLQIGPVRLHVVKGRRRRPLVSMSTGDRRGVTGGGRRENVSKRALARCL